MPKRRTRKQKETARHPFTIHWEPKKKDFEANVKRQFQDCPKHSGSKTNLEKKSENTQEMANLALIKKDIVKSLVLAALILASEVVIYFLWSG